MKVYGIYVLFILNFSLVEISLLNGQEKYSDLEIGRVFSVIISADEYNELLNFAWEPDHEDAEKIFKIIKNVIPDSNFKKEEPFQPFVVFIGIGGVNRFVYLEKLKYSDKYRDPQGNEMAPKHGFWSLYITDKSEIFVNSMEVEIITYSRTLNFSSFESASPYFPQGEIKESENVELGIKYFNVPFIPSVIKVMFAKRDVDTYERLIWNKNFKMRQRLGFELEFFIPFSETAIYRYDLVSEEISLTKLKRPVFFGLSVDNSWAREIGSSYGSPALGLLNVFKFFPNFAFGIGLPVDMDRFRDNCIFFGFSWPIIENTIKFTIGSNYNLSQKLKNGYRVGDRIIDYQINDIVEERFFEDFIFGISIMISSMNKMVSGSQ